MSDTQTVLCMRSLLCALAVAALAWYKLSESMPMDGGAALVPLLLGISVGMLVHYIGEVTNNA